jgi:hypothetical protein
LSTTLFPCDIVARSVPLVMAVVKSVLRSPASSYSTSEEPELPNERMFTAGAIPAH